MCQVGENVTNLPSYIIGVSLEQFKHFLEQILFSKDGLDLTLGARSNIGNNPTSLPPDNFLMMFQNLLKRGEYISSQKLVGMLC